MTESMTSVVDEVFGTLAPYISEFNKAPRLHSISSFINQPCCRARDSSL